MLGIRSTGVSRRRVVTTFMALALSAGTVILPATSASAAVCKVNGLTNPSLAQVQTVLNGVAPTVTFSGYCFMWDLDIDRNVKIVGTTGTVLDAAGNGNRILTIGDYSPNPTVSITGIKFVGAMGGVINLVNGYLTVNKSSFEGNTIPGVGAAIYVAYQADLFVTNSSFINNYAADSGGAIYAYYADQVSIANSTFTGNHAEYGGAIWMEYCYYGAASCLTVTRSTFTTNYAADYDVCDGQGGALYLNGAAADVTMSTFNRNWSGDGGGAIYAYDDGEANGTLTLKTSNFQSNQAFDGCGYYGDGGAVLADNLDLLVLTGSKFTGNYANDDGGAVYANDTATDVTGSTFVSNLAGYAGGALYLEGLPDVYRSEADVRVTSSSFTSNVADDDGGAINFNMDDMWTSRSTFTKNVATQGDGGAIWLGSDVGECYCFYYDLGSTFTANQALDDVTSGDGGAVYRTGGSGAHFNGTKFRNNVGTDTGGAVAVEDANFLELEGVLVSGNRVGDTGGGVYVRNTDDLYVFGDSIITGNFADYSGGGIYVEDSGDLEISGAVITGNRATHDGGGIAVQRYFADGDVTISDATIERNVTVMSGGGVYVEVFEGATDVTITDEDGPVSISYNRVSGPGGEGGGLWVSGFGDLNVLTPAWTAAGGTGTSSIVFRYNQAPYNGGGIWVSGYYGGSVEVDYGVRTSFNASGGIWFECEPGLLDVVSGPVVDNVDYNFDWGFCP